MSDEVPITALISGPDSYFTIEQITQDLSSFQKAVGGYIEAVTVPNTDLRLYCDEEGKLRGKATNEVATTYLDMLMPGFAIRDHLVGDVMFVGTRPGSGTEASIPLGHVTGFVNTAMRRVTDTEWPIVVVRYGNDIWVFDTPRTGPLDQIKELINRASNDGWQNKIEVRFAINPNTWTEMRVDMMDHWTLRLHDKRTDKSYG